MPLIKGEKVFSKEHWGAGVSLTRYLKRASYAFLLAEYEEQRLAYRDYEVPMRDMLLQVGYMQPLLSDRGKNIFAYSGSLPSEATKNSMKRSPCYPMERRF